MIDSDRHQVSNRRPLLKSASTDVIISNHGHMMDVGQVCTSSALHIILNECKASKFQA